MWADPKVLAGRTSIVSKVCRPVPLSEEIQQLERKHHGNKKCVKASEYEHKALGLIYCYLLFITLRNVHAGY